MLLIAGILGCDAPAPPPPKRPDIVVVVLDTVRADHLSLYGYGRPTMPHLARHAADARVYRHAYSSAPWTLPSHASMLTGRAPFEHGARLQPDGTPRGLDDRLDTLPEVLAESGYRTAAVVANVGFLGAQWGLARGFGHHEIVEDRAEAVTARALAWLDADETPAFLLVNYMDAHRPYHTVPPRPEVVGRSVDPTMGPLDALKEVVLTGMGDAPAGLVAEVVDQYDTALANLDRGLAPLLDRVVGRAVVVVTSDHGEFLGEHRWGEHPRDVYDPGIRVPLVVWGPGLAAGAVEDVTLSHAVPRIVLDASAQADAEERFPASLPPVSEVYADHAHYLSRPELRDRMGRVRRAWIEWPHKLIATDGAATELYDLAHDPAERIDLARCEPAVVARLTAALSRAIGRRVASPPTRPTLSAEERSQLEALGYLERAP